MFSLVICGASHVAGTRCTHMESPGGVARFAAFCSAFDQRQQVLVLQILPVESDELGLTLELLHGAAALERRVVEIKLLSLTGLWRSFHT